MKANKIVLNNEVLIDLTADTVTQNDVKKGVTFHGKDGVEYTGEYEVSLQSKTITPNDSQQVVSADGAYEGLSEVVVEPVPTESKTINVNGTYTPTSGKYFNSIIIDVPNASATLQEKTVTPTASIQEVFPDENYDGLSKVTVEAVIEPALQEKVITLTENGKVVINPDSGYDALSQVTTTVALPEYDGVVTADGSTIDFDAAIIPSGELEITENGTYDVTEFASARVNIEGEGGGSFDINGVIHEYQVEAGENVSAGDFVEFITKLKTTKIASNASSLSACRLDNYRILVVYNDANNSYRGTAFVLYVNNSITKGSETIFETHGIEYGYNSTVVLNSNSVLIAYRDSDGKGKAIILSINGDRITVGESVEFCSEARYIYAISLSPSTVITVFTDDTNASKAAAVVLSVDGTNITVGQKKHISSGEAKVGSATTLNTYKVLVCFIDVNNDDNGYAVVLSVNDAILTVGSAQSFGKYTLYNPSNHRISITKMNENTCILCYVYHKYLGNNLSDDKTYARVLKIEDMTITLGTALCFNTNYSRYCSAIILNETTAILSYGVYVHPYTTAYGTILAIDDTTLTIVSETKISDEDVKEMFMLANSELSVYLLQINNADDKPVMFKTLSIDGGVISATETMMQVTTVKKATSSLYNVGVARTDGTEGEVVEVYCVN